MNTAASAPRQQNQTQDDGMGRALAISLGAHLIAFAFLFVRAVFYPSEPMIIEDSIRVDIVSLPDKGQMKNLPPPIEAPPVAPPKPEPQPQPQVAEPPKPVEAPKPVAPVKPPPPDAPTVSFDKKKRAQQEAALKRLEAMDKIKKMMEQEASNTKVPSQPAAVKGNEISKGSSVKGLVRLEQESYLRTISAGVKRHWNLPGWLANANLSARVRLYLDARGTVVRKVFTKPSGNEDYDSRVMATVDAASPLPAPPESLVNALAVDGIELDFGLL